MAPTKPVNWPTICWMTVVSWPGDVPGEAVAPVTGNSDWMTWAAQSLPGLRADQLTLYGFVGVVCANAGSTSAAAIRTTESGMIQELRMTGLAGFARQGCHALLRIGPPTGLGTVKALRWPPHWRRVTGRRPI